MSAMAVLQPAKVLIPVEVPNVFEEASKKLGYKTGQREFQRLKNKAIVLSKLVQNGITVYSEESVSRYQRLERIRACWSPARQWTSLAILSFAVTLWVAVKWSAITLLEVPPMPFTSSDVALTGAVISTIVLIALILSTLGDGGWFWESTSLPEYGKPVPVPVLVTALQIKELYPEASLMVEELKKQKIVRDPFLVAEIGGNYFYVAVWNEPKFDSN